MFVIEIPIPQPVTEVSQPGQLGQLGTLNVQVDSSETVATLAFINKLINCVELAPYIALVELSHDGTSCHIGVKPMGKAGGQ